MSRIKERLKQYKDELSKYSKYETILVGTVMDILEELQDDLEQGEKENGWIPVEERLPDPDRYLLVSFKNFSVPMVGRYTVDDEDSETFRVGDSDETFLEHDLFVNAWMPLPKPYKED